MRVYLHIDTGTEERTEIQERLRRDVEGILQEGGVHLIHDQSFNDPLGVWLDVSVQVRNLEHEAILVVETCVIQGVSLLRSPAIQVMANTWESSSWLLTGKDTVFERAGQEIKEHLKRFTGDLFTFNPR